MILDRTIEIYSRTESMGPGSQGIPSYAYDFLSSHRASLQPIQLSQATLSQWGTTDLDANSKIVFIPGELPDVEMDLLQDLKTSLKYEIRGQNQWPKHCELLCIPYQGGDPI